MAAYQIEFTEDARTDLSSYYRIRAEDDRFGDSRPTDIPAIGRDKKPQAPYRQFDRSLGIASRQISCLL